MKKTKICLLLTFLFCSGNYLIGQPGESDEKNNIHEIQLYEREDGSKVGAIAWSTASPDSIQKFVVRNLSIMEPVQVLLQALSPNDEITLDFVKQKWDQPESSISAKGKMIGKKVFRTYKTAGMKISAQKEGIPYLIFVQVGKKLPVNSIAPFVITNDKNEYNNFIKNKEKTIASKIDEDIAVIPVTNIENGNENTTNNSSLLYIIIGLLVLMVVLLGYFVFIRKGSKKTLVVIFLLGFGLNQSLGQEGGPIQLSPEDAGSTTDTDVTALVNQTLITDLYKRLSEQATRLAILDDSYDYLNEQLNILYEQVNEGLGELNETDSYLDSAYQELRNEFAAFKNDFADNMPGEDTEGGNRIIPPEVTEADFNQLIARIRSLENQVELLSNRDRSYVPIEEDENRDMVNCNGNPECYEASVACSDAWLADGTDLLENFRELNRIIIHNDWEMEYAIDTGNHLANMAPGMALGWQQQYKNIQISRKALWAKYHAKYDELLGRLDLLLNELDSCINNAGGEYDIEYRRQRSLEGLERQAAELITPAL